MRWFFGILAAILVLCFWAVPMNLAHCEAQAHAMKNGERCGMFTIKKERKP